MKPFAFQCKQERAILWWVQFLLEGQEEIGSPNLPAFLKKHRKLLKADFALSADGGQESAEQGILVLALRGAAAFEVEIRTLDRDVHSGARFASL